MSNHTFTPGTRVSDTGKSITGTVADDAKMRREYPGMIPVHWDNGDRTVASPSILAPMVGIRAVSDDELEAELQRRRDASYEAARVTAVEYLRETPELTTQETTVTQLCRASIETGIDPAALVAAWGIVTAGAKL